jgi:hypothetical protein
MCPTAASNAAADPAPVPTTTGAVPPEFTPVDEHAPSQPEIAAAKEANGKPAPAAFTQRSPYSGAADFLSNVSPFQCWPPGGTVDGIQRIFQKAAGRKEWRPALWPGSDQRSIVAESDLGYFYRSRTTRSSSRPSVVSDASVILSEIDDVVFQGPGNKR